MAEREKNEAFGALNEAMCELSGQSIEARPHEPQRLLGRMWCTCPYAELRFDARVGIQKSAAMRSSTLVLAASLLTACFSPGVDPNATGEGSDSESGSSTVSGTDGPSGETSASSTTADATGTSTDPDGTAGETQTSTTDPNDAAPIVEAFTVNGSTRPAEVDEGGTISLEADASDDVGVVGVEFFDGEESLGVVDEAPFELDVAVSSADSGSHTYRAVATDTVGQTGESQEVVLSINIVGGEVLFYREDLFGSSSDLSGQGLGIGRTETGRVVVTGRLTGVQEGRVIAFTDDLSTLWIEADVDPTRAAIVDLGDEIVTSSWVDGSWSYEVRDLASADVVDDLVLAVPQGDFLTQLVGSRASLGGDGVVLTTATNRVASYSSSLTGPAWTAELIDDAIVVDLDPLPDGAVVLSFGTGNSGTTCSGDSTSCLRKLNADGSTAWTVPTTGGVATATAAGSVLVADARSAGGFEVQAFDNDGVSKGPAEILDASRTYLELADIADDGNGGFVVSATVGTSESPDGLVSRYGEDTALVWDQQNLTTGTSRAFGLAVSDDAVFVCGIDDLDIDPFLTSGQGFAAKLRL